MVAKNPPTSLTFEERMAIATAKGWIPKQEGSPQALMDAEVISLQTHHDTSYGDSPKIIYRLTDGSYVAVYAFHQVLRERLAELGTKIGSRQNLQYLGSQTSRTRLDSDGNPQRYESYYVENVGDELKVIADNFAF